MLVVCVERFRTTTTTTSSTHQQPIINHGVYNPLQRNHDVRSEEEEDDVCQADHGVTGRIAVLYFVVKIINIHLNIHLLCMFQMPTNVYVCTLNN